METRIASQATDGAAAVWVLSLQWGCFSSQWGFRILLLFLGYNIQMEVMLELPVNSIHGLL